MILRINNTRRPNSPACGRSQFELGFRDVIEFTGESPIPGWIHLKPTGSGAALVAPLRFFRGVPGSSAVVYPN
jgi:hypothetical protein